VVGGPQKPLTRADAADVFRLRSEVLAPVSMLSKVIWEVSMTDGSSSAYLSKDKQSDLVRGALPSGGDRQRLQVRQESLCGSRELQGVHHVKCL
jgi:hypothetical protein